MKKIIAIFILGSIFLSLIFNVSAESLSWYVVRNKENKQPILDLNLNIIQKYKGYYVNKEYHDESEDKVIYLTFDIGYQNENVISILDTLKEENVSSAFFVLEHIIIKNPELIQRMENENHLVCNHTAKHVDITKLKSKEELKSELEKLEMLYYDATGKQMKKYFRPPEGRFNEESMRYLCELGYKTVFWSFAYADWDNNNQMTPDKAKEKILSNLHNGEIMLLHPTSKTNALILKDIIIELKRSGYRFGTLDEL